MRRWTVLGGVALLAVVLLAVGAVYEACVALEIIPLGDLPGEAPAGESVVATAAFSGMLLGIGASVANAARPHARRLLALVLVAPAAAAFVVARFYAFDPYYAPSLRRASDDGLVPTAEIVIVVGVSLVAGCLVTTRPRLGSAATCCALLLCAFTALALRLGH